MKKISFTVDNYNQLETDLGTALLIAGHKLNGGHRWPGLASNTKNIEFSLPEAWFADKPIHEDTVKYALSNFCGIEINFTKDSYGLLKMSSFSVSDQSKFDATVGAQKAKIETHRPSPGI